MSPTTTETRIAVVVGASEWPALGPDYGAGRAAFAHSAEGLRAYLVDAGGMAVPSGNLLWLFDHPGTSIQQLGEIRRHLETCLAQSGHPRGRDAWILFYYVGHGAFAGRAATYCLLLRSTESRPLTEDTSLRLPTLADILRDVAPDSRRILILDSCFSGAAVRSFQAPLDQVTALKVQEAVPDRGVALLCASSASDVATLTDERTMFTGALLDVLTAGDSGGQPRLSLRRICELAYRRLTDLYAGDVSRPECHVPNQAGGDISSLPLFPNPAAGTPEALSAHSAGSAVDDAVLCIPEGPVRLLSGDPDTASWRVVPRPDLLEILELESPVHEDFDVGLVRLGRMVHSPHAFFRGAFALLAHDLSALPWSGATTRLCGDTAATNFEISRTPDGRHRLDLVDYGETVVGPWEFDLRRLLVSLRLLAQESGAGVGSARRCLQAALDSYLLMARAVAARPALEQEYYSFEERLLKRLGVPGILSAYRELAGTQPAPKRSGWLDVSGDSFVEEPPLLQRLHGGRRDFVAGLVQNYQESVSAERRAMLSRFVMADAVSLIAGIAEMGRQDYAVLCRSAEGDDQILLRITEARPSAYHRFFRPAVALPPINDGARVVTGMRAAQTAPDPLLGWADAGHTSFVVRGVRATATPRGAHGGIAKGRELRNLATSLAAFLARVHLRHREPGELFRAVGDDGRFAAGMVNFAFSYAEQVVADHQELVNLIRSGRYPPG